MITDCFIVSFSNNYVGRLAYYRRLILRVRSHNLILILFCSIALSACQLKLTAGNNGSIVPKNIHSSFPPCHNASCRYEINGIDETFIAVPAPGYHFVRWHGFGECHNRDVSICRIKLNPIPEALEIFLPYLFDIELTAIFHPIAIDCDLLLTDPESIEFDMVYRYAEECPLPP